MFKYVKAETDENGIAAKTGNIEIVDKLSNASLLDYGEAKYLMGQAHRANPHLTWTVEALSKGKYLVKGE
jgi:hypothetical protein